jgi:hypothetical protein
MINLSTEKGNSIDKYYDDLNIIKVIDLLMYILSFSYNKTN